MPPDLSERAAALRLLAILWIVLFHAQPLQDPGALTGVAAYLRHALVDVGARAGVPVLTALSGYFVFASRADRAPRRLYARKARSLLVPLLVWNAPVVALVVLLQARGLAGGLTPVDPSPFGLLDATLGLSRMTPNYPLTFLRDLFALALLAPALGVALRRAPVPTLAGGVAIFLAPDGPVLFREQMLPAFLMGGAVARRPGLLRALDRHGVPCAAAFALGCLGLSAAGTLPPPWVQLFALASVPLLWAAAGRLPRRIAASLAALSPASFFVFVAHAPILAASWIAWRTTDLPPQAHWTAGPVFALALLLVIYRFVLPRLPSGPVRTALGGRLSPI